VRPVGSRPGEVPRVRGTAPRRDPLVGQDRRRTRRAVHPGGQEGHDPSGLSSRSGTPHPFRSPSSTSSWPAPTSTVVVVSARVVVDVVPPLSLLPPHAAANSSSTAPIPIVAR